MWSRSYRNTARYARSPWIASARCHFQRSGSNRSISEEDAFAHSLGVHQGAPERIEIEFDPRIARYVKERMWHSSQEIEEQADGTVRLTLNVSNDFALRSWILGFGPLAKVVSPPNLAAQIVEEIDGARKRYE